MKVTQEIPLITGSIHQHDRERHRYDESVPDHSARRGRHDSQSHAAHQRRRHDSAQDRAGRLLARRELADSADISTNKRSIKTTMLIEDGGIIVLGRPDAGHGHRERGSGAGTRRHSAPRQSVQVAQRLAPEEATCWFSCAPKILRDRHGDRGASATRSTTKCATRSETLHKGKITLLPGEKQPRDAGDSAER